MDPESPIFLPAFRLPKDFAWQNGLVANIERYLVERRVPISYTIPRFVGYCYHKGLPVAYCRDVRSVLAITPLVEPLANDVRKITKGAFNITSGRDDGSSDPLYILIHDRWDGSCSLWPYEAGRRFATSNTPILNEEASDET